MRVVEQWHRLPRKVVDALPLETLKVRLDGARSSLIELEMSEHMTSKCPPPIQAFYVAGQGRVFS